MSMGQIGSEALEDTQGKGEADPWAAAFAALEQVGGGDDAGAAGQGIADTGADGADGGTGPAADAQSGNGEGDAGEPGGPVDPDVEIGGQDVGAEGDLLGITEDDVAEYRDGLVEDVRDRTVGDIAKAFIDRGIRHRDGRLGANIDDPDICKRDSDGVPRFYNPETGREFTGDNPRRQAQEWVDDYNRELADAFNRACEKYEETLMEQEAPSLAVLEFAPKYEALDPIRRGMLDSVLEDYEIEEDGMVVGYSVDLDKALALVDRQVAMIQGYARENAPKKEEPPATGPALDMGNSASAVGGNGGRPNFKSLAEAMEWQQNQLLAGLE